MDSPILDLGLRNIGIMIYAIDHFFFYFPYSEQILQMCDCLTYCEPFLLCRKILPYVIFDGKYKLVITEIYVTERKVTKIKKRSSFFVTPTEAAMMLNHPEFITVYEILAEPEDFYRQFSEISGGSMQTLHDNGRLYMEFNKSNNHVNRKIFRLNEDIHGLYYATDYGQLIVAAYSLKDIHDIEKTLSKNEVGGSIIATAKYEFKEPILYEFIQSDFEDFTDFLEFLNT
jgi:hypothetical protein